MNQTPADYAEALSGRPPRERIGLLRQFQLLAIACLI